MTEFPDKRRQGWLKRMFRGLAWLLLVGMLLSILAVLLLRWVNPPTSAFMIARTLEARMAGQSDFAIDRRWVDFDAMSPWLPLAVIASEDQKFVEHTGFDIEAIEDAIADARTGKRVRGASTISQQVAKNLFLWSGKHYIRKALEAWFTLLIETAWPKKRIIEVYLNIAEFGDGIYGVEAASRRFFGRDPEKVSRRQAAMLATVLPNPKRLRADAPGPWMKRRAIWIERQMKQLGGAEKLQSLE